MKVAFHTLGCKVNQYESAALEDIFRSAGHQVVDFKEQSDVYIINTCTVTHLSDRKSRQAIRRGIRRNPAAIVAVVGCYSQVSPQEVESIPGVDIVVGTKDRTILPRLVEEVSQKGIKINIVREDAETEGFEDIPWPEEVGRTRAFLKIQEGCEEYCSYCIIPYARGQQRSQKPQAVVDKVAEIKEKGYKELVLTGTHLGAYGRDLKPPLNLTELLHMLRDNLCPERVRLSSIEPVDVSHKLLETLKTMPELCHHLHIPLQSGSDNILQAMQRPYLQKDFRNLVEQLKRLDSDIAISTDVIVGFPGEKEEDFKKTLAFVREMSFSRLHVFKYSPREGTPAANFPERVTPGVAEERSRQLRQLGEKLASQYAARFINRKVPVLLEREFENGVMEGLTEHYLRVKVEAPPEIRGKIMPIFITNSSKAYLFGKI